MTFPSSIKKAFPLLIALLLMTGTQLFAQQSNYEEKLKSTVYEFGKDLDLTIHKNYNFLEKYGKELIDDDIQAVPYRVTIIQPKRSFSKEDKIYTEPNSIEIIQHGFIYDLETFNPDPIGRKYKTLKLAFTGNKGSRKLNNLDIEIYEKDYKRRQYFWVHINDKAPITDISDNFAKNYSYDKNTGITPLDNNVSIERRSNMEDAEQIAKEQALANQTSKSRPKVTKTLGQIKNTPAQPLRNEFKNRFYRVHLNHFSNLVFHIYETHMLRSKDSDNYMLDFLKESTSY